MTGWIAAAAIGFTFAFCGGLCIYWMSKTWANR
jgi:hypothetical protein